MLDYKYTSASRKRVTQEKLKHRSPVYICDTVQLNTLLNCKAWPVNQLKTRLIGLMACDFRTYLVAVAGSRLLELYVILTSSLAGVNEVNGVYLN